jgi:hypothetical protein
VLGGRPKSCWKVSLNRRILPKPAASATSAIGSLVSWINCLASSTRRVCATAIGDAPEMRRKSRRSCRSPTPTRSASVSTSAPSSPSFSISHRARDTVFDVPRHTPRSGAVSGRHRRHGRKPAS